MKIKIRKLIAAAAAVLISAAVSACSGHEEPIHAEEQTAPAQTTAPAADAAELFDFGETVRQNEAAPAAIIGVPVRIEAIGKTPVPEDEIAPPTDGAELSLLITDDCMTDYAAAAEQFKALGGNVKVTKTTRGELCGAVSASVLSKRSVDIAQFDNGMMFPYAAANGLIEPCDLAVNVCGKKWDKCRELSADFTMNNWHYVLAFGRSAETVLYYNKDTLAAYGLPDPAKLYSENEWTTERFCDMLRSRRSMGGECTIAGHDFERGLLFGSGQTMIRYDTGAEGYSSNIYIPEINDVMGMIYGLKYDDIIGGTDAGSLDDALRGGVLFWSGTYAEGQSSSLSQLSAVPFPTLKGDKKCYAAKYDGLVLVKGTPNTDSARAFFECALAQSRDLTGKFAEAFCPKGKALYDFGMGISPMVSDSSAHANEDFDKAIVPLLYSADPNMGSWDDVCYHFSYYLHPELTTLNNALANRIFGNQNSQ